MTADSGIPILDRYHDPTIRDGAPGMRQPLCIRRTSGERQAYGVGHAVRTASPLPGAGNEYPLTKPQALCLCHLSRASRAAAVRRMLVTAFQEQRLTGPPCGVGGHQGLTRRAPDPGGAEATPVMVIMLGPIAGDAGGLAP